MIDLSLRTRRRAAGLSIQDVAFLSGGRIYTSNLSCIERGLRNASPRERAALANVLGVPEEELFKDRDAMCPGEDKSG